MPQGESLCGKGGLTMMNGACVSGPSEDLFSIDPDEDDRPTETTRSSLSPEMAALVGAVEAKQERRQRRPKTVAAATFGRTLTEVDEMIRSGEWTGATPRHLVALYDRMHEKCYGIAPEELGPSERYKATMLAANMVKHKFGGDVVECVEFMRWAWTKEISTEKWRRDNDKPGRRIGVRLMFSGVLLTDYRLALARKGRRP